MCLKTAANTPGEGFGAASRSAEALLPHICPMTRTFELHRVDKAEDAISVLDMQADMPTPAISAPISLPRQASPVYTSKPFFSSSTTGSAALQSTSPVMAHQSSISPVAAQYSSATSTATAQLSSSSTATAAMLASLKQQREADLSLGSASPPSEAQRQAGQQTQATATSRRYMSCL